MNKVFIIENIDCANCAAKIENEIRKIDGVINANLNFFTQKLKIEAQENDFKEIIKKAKKISRKIEPDCEISEG